MDYYIESIENYEKNSKNYRFNLSLCNDKDQDLKRKGYLSVFLTEHNDFGLYFTPWNDLHKNKDKPSKYSRKNISKNTSISEDEEGYKIRSENKSILIDENNIEVELKNNESINIDLKPTLDLKDNKVANGLGYRTEITNNNPELITNTYLTMNLNPDESIYGGGARYKDINHRESVITSQVTQGAGAKSDATYISSPLFISSREYGFLVNTYNTVESDFGVSSNEKIAINSTTNTFEILFTSGESMNNCLENLNKYTEKQTTKPIWSYGLWSSRNSYSSWDEVHKIIDKYKKENIPLDVIHIDPDWLSFSDYNFKWTKNFKNPRKNIKKIHEKDIKICIWVYPYVPISSNWFKNNPDYFVKNSNNTPLILDDNGRKISMIDFTNEDAFDWWSSKLSSIISDGVDAIKADFGEYITDDAVFHNYESGKTARNKYPEIYQKACEDAFKKSNRVPLLWSRSGWLSQNTSSIHWGGDSESDWNGYRSTIKSGLNAGMSLYPYWSSDIGGYKKNPTDNLYAEWMKWACFGNSHIRTHGKSPREPWVFDTKYDEIKKSIKHRYKIIPYLYSYGKISKEKGIPIMRPMVLEENTPMTQNLNTQHMIGDNILVAPYIEKTNKERKIYLPKTSTWINYWTGESYESGKIIESNKSIIPLFVKKGSPIPVSDGNKNSNEITDINLTIFGSPEKEQKTQYTPINENKTYEIKTYTKNNKVIIEYNKELEFNTINLKYSNLDKKINLQ